MNLPSIIIIFFIVLAFAAAIGNMWRHRKTGCCGGGCSGNCSACSGSCSIRNGSCGTGSRSCKKQIL